MAGYSLSEEVSGVCPSSSCQPAKTESGILPNPHTICSRNCASYFSYFPAYCKFSASIGVSLQV
jgi:hypothetical protein